MNPVVSSILESCKEPWAMSRNEEPSHDYGPWYCLGGVPLVLAERLRPPPLISLPLTLSKTSSWNSLPPYDFKVEHEALCLAERLRAQKTKAEERDPDRDSVSQKPDLVPITTTTTTPTTTDLRLPLPSPLTPRPPPDPLIAKPAPKPGTNFDLRDFESSVIDLDPFEHAVMLTLNDKEELKSVLFQIKPISDPQDPRDAIERVKNEAQTPSSDSGSHISPSLPSPSPPEPLDIRSLSFPQLSDHPLQSSVPTGSLPHSPAIPHPTTAPGIEAEAIVLNALSSQLQEMGFHSDAIQHALHNHGNDLDLVLEELTSPK
uniref:UBA domain-containing protein n=1 Tax=Eptatretus burgeri TaxID=7764 RepID=A0A8C4Q8L8_EPTBU